MFERYSIPSRRAIYFARKAALQAGATEIDSIHLLTGLIEEKSSHANSLFRLDERFPREAAALRAAGSARDKNIPLANDCKRILWYARREADRLASKWINTDHLLLGILCDHESTAASRLQGAGIEIEAARAQVSSSALKPEDHGFFPEFWQPSTPHNIAWQTAAAAVVLGLLLFKLFTERGC